MHRLAKIGIVLAFVMALGGVGAGIVAAQSSADNTPTPSASVATAEEEPAADATPTPSDGSSTPQDQEATPEGHLCPDQQGQQESPTATTA